MRICVLWFAISGCQSDGSNPINQQIVHLVKLRSWDVEISANALHLDQRFLSSLSTPQLLTGTKSLITSTKFCIQDSRTPSVNTARKVSFLTLYAGHEAQPNSKLQRRKPSTGCSLGYTRVLVQKVDICQVAIKLTFCPFLRIA